ncbi:hypothetical protein [Actinomadura sp. CNU-125]|uniref:hypothetical protein n=1 Tax=Actinomadura sp. CNU-125 TaxID=1904961 RepID=UPI000AF5DC65|nr:hypothetical protein [Actinomadura sp. CNU-125]
MTPPAEQSAVHDEEAGTGQGPRERDPEAPERRPAAAGRTAPAVRDEPDAASETASESDTTEKDEGEKKGKARAKGKHARKGGDEPEDAAAGTDPAEPENASEGQDARAARRDPRDGAGTVRQGELIQALTVLRERLGAFEFVLDLPGAGDGKEARDELRAQIEDYVLPRIQAAGTPLLVVLGGSTGAGKSTLVNTLVGSRVSATGVLRPTTSSPILVCHPDHADWFLEGALLPGMGRVRGPAPDAIAGDQLVVIASDALPPGLALLDSPDFDSVFEDHYEFATKLMAAATCGCASPPPPGTRTRWCGR